MPGNDFTDFLTLSPGLGEVSIDAFESTGVSPMTIFEQDSPALFKNSSGIPMTIFSAEDYDFSIFKNEVGTGSAAIPISYRMRGYYVAGATFEYWITTNPSAANPSGNPLVSVTVDATIE
jgi:hypothetical protein